MQPLFWDKSLTYEIQPKSGPVRRMVTLADVRTAMVYDLPPGTTKQPHWLNAGMLVVAASEIREAGRHPRRDRCDHGCAGCRRLAVGGGSHRLMPIPPA